MGQWPKREKEVVKGDFSDDKKHREKNHHNSGIG